jgi:hypothetical protein
MTNEDLFAKLRTEARQYRQGAHRTRRVNLIAQVLLALRVRRFVPSRAGHYGSSSTPDQSRN